MESNKKKYGQFYTQNYAYIFQDMSLEFVREERSLIEPFTGNGDLIPYILEQFPMLENLECFDIDSKNCVPREGYGVFQRDTLIDIPEYTNKFVITNPPYLAKNKCKDKKYFDLHQTNDLYKCFLKTILDQAPNGGLIIIPLNFWCSIRALDVDLRKRFLQKFDILRVNVFEESVFKDTTYTVCSILFVKKDLNSVRAHGYLPMFIYPCKKSFEFFLNAENNWTIGGDIYQLPRSKHQVSRLLEGGKPNTKILLKALDDDAKKQICLSMSEDPYFGKNTSRTYASILIEPKISEEKQTEIVKRFNEFMEANRVKYHSLFLTNYRESKDISRKRVSFELAYQIIQYLLLGME
jgi:hypothetical protein